MTRGVRAQPVHLASFRGALSVFGLALILTLAGAVEAADQPSAPKPKPKACAAPEARQFDFWIGSWEVRLPNGKVAGTNRIEPILGGCVLQEHWKGMGGMSGTSINMYDPSTKRWHQTWMDDHGTLLQLDGGLVDGKMILTGEAPEEGKPGVSIRQRITWSRLDGGKVRQVWETSADSGATWKVVFDGTYSRAG